MIYSLAILVSLVSCKSESSKIKEQEKKKLEIQFQEEKTKVKTLEIQVAEELTKKYQAKYMWDTIYHVYTKDYNKVIETNYQIISAPQITDIYYVDSLKYVSVKVFSDHHLYFNLAVSDSHDLLLGRHGYFHLLVVHINNIKKIGDLQKEVYGDFFGEGELIEVRSIKYPENPN